MSDSTIYLMKAVQAKLDIDIDFIKSIRSACSRPHYRATLNWLTKYKPFHEASNWKQVEPLLEAFNHLCQVQAWEKAKEIFLIRMPFPTQKEFYDQLGIWGYYQESAKLSEALLGKLSHRIDVICLRWLGIVSQLYLNNYPEAFCYFQKSREIAKEQGLQDLEIGILLNLGSLHRRIGKYPEAISFFEQSLTFARKIGDRQQEASAIGFLGLTNMTLNNYSKAAEFYEESLEILRATGDRQSEAEVLGNLGKTCMHLGAYDTALEYMHEAWAFTKSIDSKYSEGWSRRNLGTLFARLGKIDNAEEHLSAALKIFEDLGNLPGQCEVLESMAELQEQIYSSSKNVRNVILARDYCDRALNISKSLELPLTDQLENLSTKISSHMNWTGKILNHMS